jgi:deazaflavin-dependent oxidoreductase (nitroreductase family)
MLEFADRSICSLTTIGRKTGRRHTIEIWFAAVEHSIYLLSGGGDGADWVRNIMANPEVEIGVDTRSWKGKGAVIVDPDEQAAARRSVYDKYQPGYAGDLTTWRHTALPVRIILD